jgi:hypothetical protein
VPKFVADSSVSPTGLKWAAPASGGGMTLLSTTNLSGSSTEVTGISGSYNTLLILVAYGLGTSAGSITARLNDATSNYLLTFSKTADTALVNQTSNIPINAGTSQNDTGDSSTNKSAILVYDYTTTNSFKPIQFFGAYRETSTSRGINGGGNFYSTAAVTSFKMVTSGGTLEGSIRIYGIK